MVQSPFDVYQMGFARQAIVVYADFGDVCHLEGILSFREYPVIQSEAKNLLSLII